jgi:hypothetical protein
VGEPVIYCDSAAQAGRSKGSGHHLMLRAVTSVHACMHPCARSTTRPEFASASSGGRRECADNERF